MVFSLGLMVEYMKVNTLKIKNKERVYLHGLMVESMMENGLMVNNTVMENTLMLREK